MSSKYKIITRETTADAAISDFYNEVEELANECREVVDSAEGGRANTQRILTLGESADTLESIGSGPDAPNDLPSLPVTVSIQVPRSKRQSASRATRRDNATSAASVAIQVIREYCDGEDEKLEELEGEERENLELRIQTYRDLCDEIESHAEEADGAEFPGMMG